MSLSSLKIQLSQWANQNISLEIQGKNLLLYIGDTQFILPSQTEIDKDFLSLEFLPNDGFQIKHQNIPLACFLEKNVHSYSNHTVFSRGVFPRYSETVESLHFFHTNQPIELSWLAQFPNLKDVSIHHSKTSAVFPAISKLRSLHVQYCNELIELNNLEHSKDLIEFKIQWCSSLKHLPRFLSSKLEILHVEWCQQVSSLFDLNLPNLKQCSFVSFNHHDFQALSQCNQLEYLNISWFKRALYLPNLSDCQALKTLHLRSLSQTTNLPILPKDSLLEELDCSEMYQLKSLSFPPSSKLKSLYADGCRELEIVDLSSLPNLEFLSLLRVPALEEIEGLDSTPHLKKLDLSDSKDLLDLENLMDHPSLQNLSLNNCSSLQTLPPLDAIPHLQSLKIYNCNELMSLRSSKNENFQHLQIGGCRSLKQIPDLLNFPNMLTLAIAWFHGSTPIKNVSSLKNLKELRLSGHSGLRSLQLHGLKQLEKIDCSRCRHLEILESSECENLHKIIAQECDSLRNLLGFERIQSLQEVILVNCQSLENIDFIYYQPQLQVLDISGCQSLRKTPSFHDETLESLKILNLSNRPYPTDLDKLVSPSVGIEVLNIEGTKQIYDLSPLINLRFLKELHGLTHSEKDNILCQIFLKFRNIGAISAQLQSFFKSLPKSNQLANFARNVIQAMDLASSPLEKWKEMFAILQKKERFSLGDSPITEDLWRYFFHLLDRQRFADLELKDFFSSQINFEQEGNCLRGFLFVLFDDSHFEKEEAALILEQTYLQSSPIQQHLCQVWRDRWKAHLPHIDKI